MTRDGFWFDHLEPVDVATALTERAELLPRYRSEAWRAVRTSETVGGLCTEIVETADEIVDEPVALPTATDFIAYTNSTNPDEFLEPHRDRLDRLAILTVAECLTGDGRFLDTIVDHAWAICEQFTWIVPFHVDSILDACEHDIVVADVGRTARTLAEVEYVLGDALGDAVKKRIVEIVTARAIDPYVASHHNDIGRDLAAEFDVLSAGLLLLDDTDQLSQLLFAGLGSLRRFLERLGSDGCVPGGMDRWNRDFRRFVIFGTLFEARTNFEQSVLNDAVVRKAAQFPLRIELSPGRFVPFEDSAETNAVAPDVAVYLGNRFDLQGLYYRGLLQVDSEHADPEQLLRILSWCYDESPVRQYPTPNRQEFLADHQWWVVRNDPTNPDDVVVAAKGGQNGGEPYAHHDVGSFIVHYDRESFVTDPGYHRHFGLVPEDRHEKLHARSLGHPVPYVNGYEQWWASEGDRRTFAANVVDMTSDEGREELELDLADCYPDGAGIETLERWFYLERADPPTLLVRDAYRFAQRDNTTAFVIPSNKPIRRDGEQLHIGEGAELTVTFDKPFDDCEIERFQQGDSAGTYYGRDVWWAMMTFDIPEKIFNVTATIQPGYV